ncbi:unnamed protein product [Phaedon cochleariae]|uniref:Uncharacterized protein n=1 Tax=Phaedon cochleariae TaxID=80249 RepID=A0A9N9X5U2_PHACE|nr:unnamed protein product [Phaedon cochleariae]
MQNGQSSGECGELNEGRKTETAKFFKLQTTNIQIKDENKETGRGEVQPEAEHIQQLSPPEQCERTEGTEIQSVEAQEMTEVGERLLLLMEKGEAAQYKSKSLDEINIDLDVDLKENDNDSGDENQPFPKELMVVLDSSLQRTYRNSSDAVLQLPGSASTNTSLAGKQILKKSKRTLVPWTKEQKSTVRHFFAKHISKKVPPKKHECLALKDKNETLLENEDWVEIKVFGKNEYVKRQRQ